MNEEYNQMVLTGGRPIPGQSLTSDPSDPAPYEKPPEFVNLEEAQEWVFDTLTDSETNDAMLDLIVSGVPLEIVAQQFLFAGMASGKWNVDLMMLLIEPTIYTLLFLFLEITSR